MKILLNFYLKRFISGIVFFLFFLSGVNGQSVSECYILTRTYLQPSSASYLEDISYLNGNGYEKQRVERGAVPGGGGDLITPVYFGVFGRTERVYLPYFRMGNNGAFDANGFNAANWSAYGLKEQSYAFNRTDYDNSPLDRVVKQTAPGSSWHNSGKGVSTDYGFNSGSEVVLWHLNSDGLPVKDGYYAANTLERIRTTDEDGHFSEVYNDGRGHTLLSVEVNGSERLSTYYLYDEFDRLRCVLSPEASAAPVLSQTVLDQYCYSYRYDVWGRLIEKHLPGCAPIYMVYDKRDRLVLSQDGNQRVRNVWSYSLYDARNRVKETGEISLPGKTHIQLQAEAGGSENYLPSAARTAMQYVFYDNYVPTGSIFFHPFSVVSGYTPSPHLLTTGLITGVKSRVLETDTWLTTTIYYDDHCREIQRVGDNLLGGLSSVSMIYDFVGNVLKVSESHGRSGGIIDVAETVNTYDDRSRLLTSTITLNSGAPARVSYIYDALGHLSGKTYGMGSSAFTEHFSYNTRGWLTEKNSPVFRMELRYESPVGGNRAFFNGNISEWEWQQGANPARMYGFEYDGINRLTGTVAYNPEASFWVLNNNGYTERGLSYDRNGNILTLRRTSGGGGLEYTYTYSGNQLTGLSGGNRTGSFSYDSNGNMLRDGGRSLNFKYNSLNLLSEVTGDGIIKAKYSYLADGSKLRVRDGDEVNGYDYLGSLIYLKNGGNICLEGMSFVDGRILKGSSGYDVSYFVTDHLGSVRAIVNGTTGDVSERNDYYPFGGRYMDYSSPITGNRFKYNGKEEQTTGELGFLDYGARMYDPELGRWFGVDPLGEEYYSESVYAYCGNMPVIFTDPDGMKKVYYNADGSWSHTTHNNWFHNTFFGIKNYLANDAQGWSSVRDEEFRNWVDDVGVWHDQEALNSWALDFVANSRFQERLDELGVEYTLTNNHLEALSSHVTLALPNVLKIGSLATASKIPAQVQYFDSFSDFKKAMGPAGKGYAWHHIVEQNPANVAKFGSRALHNTKNVVRVPSGKGSVHAKVSGHYSSKRNNTRTVRQLLGEQSYKKQYKYGMGVLKKYGGL